MANGHQKRHVSEGCPEGAPGIDGAAEGPGRGAAAGPAHQGASLGRSEPRTVSSGWLDSRAMKEF